MAILKPVRVPELRGGLDTSDKTIIADNQLATATNVFYNQDKNLQTRYGIVNYGSVIADTVKLIHDCDTLAGNGAWGVTDDGAGLALDSTTQKRGAGAVKWNVIVATSANNYANLTNSTFTAVDISSAKTYLKFWFYVPTGAKTNLTNIVFKIGSGAGNYYSWTLLPADLTEGTWSYIQLLFSAGTVTGAPVDTAINYFQVTINYTGAYTDKSGWEIDGIMTYSGTSTKPMMSLKYFKSSAAAGTRYLLTNVGTSLFLYNETLNTWEAIKTGLTENTRFSMTAYKNIMYLTNGVDNYMSFDGTKVTEHTGAGTYKGKFVLLANDVGYILGDPSVPSTLGYTGATPANLQTFPNALVLDEDSSDGSGTGLINLGPVVLAMKHGKIYKVNTATPSREQIDYSNGFLSHRALVRVENEVFGINKSGIYTLAQREATIGSIRADALSDNIKSIIDAIQDKSVTSAIYLEKLKNCYFFCDTDNNGVADTALVFSVLTKSWTRYTNMAVNEAVLYTDNNGTERFLSANALSGQCRELEIGLYDNTSEINAVVETKAFDFGMPETLKTFQMVEVFGFIGATSQMTVNVLVDDEDRTGNIIINGADFVTTTGGFALATHPVGSIMISGGGTVSTTTLYPFKARIPMYATGATIQVRCINDTLNSQWILNKVSIYPTAQPVDIYPNNLIK